MVACLHLLKVGLIIQNKDKIINKNTHLTPTQEIQASPVEKEILSKLTDIQEQFTLMEKHEK